MGKGGVAQEPAELPVQGLRQGEAGHSHGAGDLIQRQEKQPDGIPQLLFDAVDGLPSLRQRADEKQ